MSDVSMLPHHEPCGIGYGALADDMSITCEVRRAFVRVGFTKDKDRRPIYEHTDRVGCGAVSRLDPGTGQRSMVPR